MDGLEMPAVLSRFDLERDDGVAKQVGAFAIAAVGAGDRRRERHVEQPARLVEREIERPGVDAEALLPAVAGPRVVPGLARLRDRAELPQFRAAARVVGARVAEAAD